MNRDDVIRMAREAGFAEWENTDSPDFLEITERFAVLVAAHEREECAKVCEQLDGAWDQDGGCIKCAAEIRARGES